MHKSIYDFSVQTINGRTLSLDKFRGRVLLIVNVASKCGLTKQYEALEDLYRRKQDQGFEILAFPANNFSGQEPDADDEINRFCRTNYSVTFRLFSKISAAGEDQHPLYRTLTTMCPDAIGDGPFRAKLKEHGVEPGSRSDVLWNFEKFVVDRLGEVVGRFSPDIEPNDPDLLGLIEAQLARKDRYPDGDVCRNSFESEYAELSRALLSRVSEWDVDVAHRAAEELFGLDEIGSRVIFMSAMSIAIAADHAAMARMLEAYI